MQNGWDGNGRKKYILFGAGERGQKAFSFFGTDQVAYFCDNSLAGTMVHQKKVLSFSELKEIYSDYLIVITPIIPRFVAEIAIQLHMAGIPFTFLNEEKEKIRRYEAIVKYAHTKGVSLASIPDDFIEKEKQFLIKYDGVNLSCFTIERVGEIIALFTQAVDGRFSVSCSKDVFLPISYNEEKNEAEIFNEERIANHFLYNKVCNKVEIITAKNIQFWAAFCQRHWDLVTCYDRYSHTEMMKNACKDLRTHYYDDKLFLLFTEKEKEYGVSRLALMGVKGKYVCFFARSQKYLNTIYHKDTIHPNDICRNHSLKKFQLMVSRLMQQNIQSVRMGYLVDGKAEWPGCIDYANHFRDEMMDFYTIAHGLFLVCGYTGLQLFATLFNKPIVTINAHLITFTGDIPVLLNYHRDLILFKKLYNRRTKHFLTLREILKIEEAMPNQYERMRYLLNHDYEFIENTPEEIWEITAEMLERVEGKCTQQDKLDQQLQQRYRNILMKSVKKPGREGIWYPEAMVGRSYLRQNQWWLE